MTTVLWVSGVVLVVLALGAGYWWWTNRREHGDGTTFSGTFTYGWEVSSFVPDGATSKKYWLAWTPDSGFMEQLKAHGYDAAWTPGYAEVHVRFEGTLEGGKGGYGHMGQYDGQMMVLNVIEMGTAERKDQH